MKFSHILYHLFYTGSRGYRSIFTRLSFTPSDRGATSIALSMFLDCSGQAAGEPHDYTGKTMKTGIKTGSTQTGFHIDAHLD